MRMSRLFSQTLREAPADTDVASHQLLLRAGFIRQLGAGIFSYMPLARRAMTKIENIIRQEMDAIGGQEMTMPVVHPSDIWKETRRYYEMYAEMTRFQDRGGREMVLAMTHEEVVTDLVRKEIRSYRQLPALVYHIQTKWRDEPRPRAGLIRVREFTMKDSYSLDADWEGLDKQYHAHHQAYFNIYQRCGLPVIAVKSDVGMMGGKLAHEFMYVTPIGEDTLLLCDQCHYSANREIARFQKEAPPDETPLQKEKIETPNTMTIEALAKFLNIPESKTAKAVFMIAKIKRVDVELNDAIVQHMRDKHDLLIGKPTAQMMYEQIGTISASAQQVSMAMMGHNLKTGLPEKVVVSSIEIREVYDAIPDEYTEKFVLAIVRGDTDVNESKLAHAVKAISMRPATEAEILAVGAVSGYGSAIGVQNALVVVDDLISVSPNLVAGANEPGYHYLNVNHLHRRRGDVVWSAKDFEADVVTDIASAREGDACPNCGQPLRAVRGVEVGNIFKLGTRFSAEMGATFLDNEGNSKPVIMGSYGIGVGRLLACVAEHHHDEQGLIWPVSITPYHLYLVSLPGGEAQAESLYADLQAQGVEVLFDERDERPGVKFNDADLIGLPLRITVSKRSLEQGGVEFKRRDKADKEIVPIQEICAKVKAELNALQAEIDVSVVPVPFDS